MRCRSKLFISSVLIMLLSLTACRLSDTAGTGSQNSDESVQSSVSEESSSSSSSQTETQESSAQELPSDTDSSNQVTPQPTSSETVSTDKTTFLQGTSVSAKPNGRSISFSIGYTEEIRCNNGRIPIEFALAKSYEELIQIDEYDTAKYYNTPDKSERNFTFLDHHNSDFFKDKAVIAMFEYQASISSYYSVE